MAKRGKKQKILPPLKLGDKLVLSRWMLSLFGVDSFKTMADGLKSADLEGFDENNVSNVYYSLILRKQKFAGLNADILLAYDQNISKHWRRITYKRNRAGHKLELKYFQYLSLLFTEIYLDRYFSDPESLVVELNHQVTWHNINIARTDKEKLEDYKKADLNKLAFWMATGSGKTLLMHVNILQYLNYAEKHGKKNAINRIVLLTPNEGLSHQHLLEFAESGLDASLFSKGGGRLFSGSSIEIIEVSKLREDSGDKTVAVSAFEGNNLVLIDEGHRGTSGKQEKDRIGHWLQMRKELCEDGFSFEYSATFGQAMAKAKGSTLEQQYARCILFDYSYRYFYEDGYGKNYKILNLPDDKNRQEDEELRLRYLTACLVSFYQQQKVYKGKKEIARKYLIERPLWVFVGSSVTKTTSKKDISDVVEILLFLAGFVADEAKSKSIIELLLNGQSGLHNSHGQDLFGSHSFSPIVSLGLSTDQVFADILRTLFNAPSKAKLHIEHLKGSEGEIALRLGDNDPFGVINIGDPVKLTNLCEVRKELVTTNRDFSGSLFRELNTQESRINILIGSRKFTEGWSSWRVSTMGLMNIGKNEGSQIIQLFGRGVRLKGKDFNLKRSSRLIGENVPDGVERLETLNIFGVHADYMKQFREYLEEEGLQDIENRIEFILPVIKNLGDIKLKVIRLNVSPEKFKREGSKPTLDLHDGQPKKIHITLDWYPKIQAMASRESGGVGEIAEKNEDHFNEKHMAFLDLDALFFEMEEFKNERAWFNLNLSRLNIRRLLLDASWYSLLIPPDELEFRSFEQVRQWREIAGVLLKRYAERYYLSKKAEYESDFLEYQELQPDDPNFIEEYRLLIDQSRQDIIDKLNEIKALIDSDVLKPADFGRLDIDLTNFKTISFAGHLYQPLIYANGETIEVKPVALNKGERDFVLDLRQYYDDNQKFFADKKMYLLRNKSKGKGIGFFQAGNFYPDFILWLLIGDKQYISFVDPKGLRNLKGKDDPKIAFYETIKSLENDLKPLDSTITLNSFIVSNTDYEEIKWWGDGMTKEQFKDRHVLFQNEDKSTYIYDLFELAKESI